MAEHRQGNGTGHAGAFFRETLRNYRQTGAVMPSSPHLAKKIVATARMETRAAVVEIGPGTGVFTEELLRVKSPATELCLVEKNPAFASLLRERFPGLPVFAGCASELGSFLETRGLDGVDAVVSGLPWAAMPVGVQELLLREIFRVLRPGGMFVTFAYFGPHLLPAGRSFRLRMEALFPSVGKTGVVFNNIPPAFVYHAEKSA